MAEVVAVGAPMALTWRNLLLSWLRETVLRTDCAVEDKIVAPNVNPGVVPQQLGLGESAR
jgi:hypothetical protein